MSFKTFLVTYWQEIFVAFALMGLVIFGWLLS